GRLDRAGAGELVQERLVLAEVGLRAAGRLEDVDTGLDDERPPRLRGSATAEAGDPAALPAEAGRVGAGRPLVVEHDLRAAVEGLERCSDVLLLEDELAQVLAGNGL